MKSVDLINELALLTTIGSEKILFTPSQVLWAATLAQNDILTKLKIVDQTIQLALASGQESYTFPPQTPSGVDTDDITGEVKLTITKHPYHTGDELVVSGGTGGVNGRYFANVLDANSVQLTGSVAATPTVTASTRVYHALQAAVDMSDRAPIRKVSTAGNPLTGYITKKSHGEYEKFREEFGSSTVDEPSVINVMVEKTSPCITLQFQGTPGADILTQIKIVRRALPCERLAYDKNNPTAAVDPILPDVTYDDLLMLGVKAFMLRYREEQVFRGVMIARRYIPGPKEQAWQNYQAALQEAQATIADRDVVFLNSQPDSLWPG